MTLFLHYLKLAFRNLLKYRAQNIICVLSIAVSAMLLTFVWSFLRELIPPEIIGQPYADKVCTLAIALPETPDGYWHIDQEAMKSVEKMQLRTAERIAIDKYVLTSFKLTAETDEGNKRITSLNGTGVKSDYLRWYGYRSKVSGLPVPELADNEVVITQRLANKLFGKTNVIGETIQLEDITNGTLGARNFRIADVIHPSLFLRKAAINDLYYNVEEFPDKYIEQFSVQLRDGFTADDLRAEVEKMFPTDRISTEKKSEELRKEYSYVLITKYGILTLLIAFLAISVIGFLRMKSQLFRIRQREIALRTVLGSKRQQLIALFSTEIALVLILALSLTLVLNSLMKNILGVKLRYPLGELYWPMDDLFEISAIIFLAIAVVSIVLVWLVVRNIRRQQTGLAFQMKPSRGSAMSVATITFQLMMSTIFVCITIGATHIILNNYNKQGIPSNDNFYKNCYTLRLPSEEYADKGMVLLEHLQHSENIDHLVTLNVSGDRIILADTAEVNGNPYYYVRTYFQQDREMLDFFAIEPIITNPKANPQKSIFVSEEMMLNMQQGGTWERGYIDVMLKSYDIAGYYERLPYTMRWETNAIITDPDHFVEDPLVYPRIVVPKKGCESEVKREIEAFYNELGRIDFQLMNYREDNAPVLDVLDVLLIIFIIVAVISLISTVASIFSVISLDTRRRRKEVALRKVNGAKTGVIARMFARRYIIICSVCFVILLPLCLGFFLFVEDPSDLGFNFWTLYLPTVLIISLIVFFTIVWKIREVMHLKPAEWLSVEL